jgi:hypothetical protein
VGDDTAGKTAAIEPTEAAVLAAYAAVAARRAQWDSLVWQVPTLSLTAQAFLLTIALSQGNDAWARIISAILSLNITVISIMLMARHRQAEIHDAHWLEHVERDVLHLGALVSHGPEFRRSREQQKLSAGPIGRAIPLVRMFPIWVIGLGLFGLSDVLVIIRTLATL